jgi:hypothetical protein
VDGKEIRDSNISDLVSDAMRARRNFNPKGAQEFFFADCQRLMYPKILQETWKDGIRFKWAVRLARKRLFLRHRHRDHRHYHVQVPQNICGLLQTKTKTMASLLKNVVTVCMY